MEELGDIITKEVSDHIEIATNAAIDSLKEVVDERSQKCFEMLQKNTQVDTGGLQKSLTINKLNSINRYGYTIDFDGYNERGIAYSKIARALNNGSQNHLKSQGFINRAVRTLKGMDDEIDERFEQKMNEIK